MVFPISVGSGRSRAVNGTQGDWCLDLFMSFGNFAPGVDTLLIGFAINIFQLSHHAFCL